MPSSLTLTTGRTIARIAAAVLGGYAFVWGFTTLVIALGLVSGGSYGDAQTLAYLLAFLVFLVSFLWAFATPRLGRAWAVLAGGGVLMAGSSWLLTQGMV